MDGNQYDIYKSDDELKCFFETFWSKKPRKTELGM